MEMCMFNIDNLKILVTLNGHLFKIMKESIYIFDIKGNMNEVLCINKNGELTYFTLVLNGRDIWWDFTKNEIPDTSKIKILRYVGDFINWKTPIKNGD